MIFVLQTFWHQVKIIWQRCNFPIFGTIFWHLYYRLSVIKSKSLGNVAIFPFLVPFFDICIIGFLLSSPNHLATSQFYRFWYNFLTFVLQAFCHQVQIIWQRRNFPAYGSSPERGRPRRRQTWGGNIIIITEIFSVRKWIARSAQKSKQICSVHLLN